MNLKKVCLELAETILTTAKFEFSETENGCYYCVMATDLRVEKLNHEEDCPVLLAQKIFNELKTKENYSI